MMKACREWEQFIVEYVDGVIEEQPRRSLEAHLASCTACAEAVRVQRWAKQVVAQLEREHAPDYLSRRIRHHARGSVRRQGAIRLLARASFATVVAASLLLAFWWGNLRPEKMSAVPVEEPTVAQAIVQEYVGAMSNDGFTDPSLQLLAREAQWKTLRLEPIAP